MEQQRGTKMFCSPRCKMARRRRSQKEGRIAAKEAAAQGKLLNVLVEEGWLGDATVADFDQPWKIAVRIGASASKVRRIERDAAENPKQAAAFLKTLHDLTYSVRHLVANNPVGVNTFSQEGAQFAIRRLDDLTAEIDKLKAALSSPAQPG
jgi:hypothetical protein